MPYTLYPVSPSGDILQNYSTNDSRDLDNDTGKTEQFHHLLLSSHRYNHLLPPATPITFPHLNKEACFIVFIIQSKSNLLQCFTAFLAGQKVLSDSSQLLHVINIICYGSGAEILQDLGL